MTKSIYNAVYLAVFIHFLREILAKFIYRGDGTYSLYVEGIERRDRSFTALIAKSTDRNMLVRMGEHLRGLNWTYTVAMDGHFCPSEICEIIPIGDPQLKDLLSKADYAELVSALEIT